MHNLFLKFLNQFRLGLIQVPKGAIPLGCKSRTRPILHLFTFKLKKVKFKLKKVTFKLKKVTFKLKKVKFKFKKVKFKIKKLNFKFKKITFKLKKNLDFPTELPKVNKDSYC